MFDLAEALPDRARGPIINPLSADVAAEIRGPAAKLPQRLVFSAAE
jgi:hypothetical protein